MAGALAATKRVKPPQELAAFFDNPPLLGNEKRSDFDAVFSAIVMAEPPTDAIDWMLLYDYAVRVCEIRRERWMKAEIIKFHQKMVVKDLLKATFDKTNRLGDAENRIFHAPTKAQSWASDRGERKKIDAELDQKGHDPASVLAQAYIRGAHDIDAIDKRIASYEVRRSAALREISQRDARRAEKLRQASLPVIDVEFSLAAE